MSKKISKKVVISEEENNSDSSSSEPVIITKKSKNTKVSPKVSKPDTRTLPALYSVDSKGKDRVWKCWVIENTIYREHGLVTGKKILSERTFEGKSIGKKNETSPTEQAWMEANKEWTAHITKEYHPASGDKEGQKLLKLLNDEKKSTGGHCGNSVAAISGGTACKTKNVSRKKSDTFMTTEVEGGDVIPMKAQVWELTDPNDPYSVSPKVAKYFSEVTGKGKNIILSPTPFYVQQKIDGFRCKIMIQTNKNGDLEAVMTTNSGKQLPWLQSLRTASIEWISPMASLDDLLDGLDGELYAMNFINLDGSPIPSDARFSTISSICGMSRSSPHPLEDQLQFHCFDLVDKKSSLTQVQRFKHLDKLFGKLPQNCKNKIIRVEPKILNNIKEVVECHNLYTNLGYEGIMLRTFNLKYKTKSRSPELRKFKMFLDAEYEIVGSALDKGTSPENFCWILKTECGNEFNCKPMGTREEKIEWYKNKTQFVGKFLTVKYQELSEDNIPRFPIGKSIRAGVGMD